MKVIIFLIDFNEYIFKHGFNSSIDNRLWYQFNAPFKKEFNKWYASEIIGILNKDYENKIKVIVFDCDWE